MTSPFPDGQSSLRPVTGRDSSGQARKRHRRFARLGRRLGDEGFVLLETLVAISLISVVMAGFTTFFMNSVASTSLQRATQAATEVANSVVEKVRGLPASDLTKGRDSVGVSNQLSTVISGSPLSTWLSLMTAVSDPAAAVGSGATATVPTSPVVFLPINNVVYTVNEYLGACDIPTALRLGANCLAPDLAAKTPATHYLRLVVAVTWSGSRCGQTQCTYLTSTVLSAAADPLFNLSTSPPVLPVLTYPGPKVAAVNDVVTLRPTFTAYPRYRFSIAGVLPVGLSLNLSTGLISGVPLVVTPIVTLTVTLTDGFDRTVTADVTLTVVPTLLGTAPPAQSGVVGTPIPTLTVRASGGETPYGWTVPAGTLPPGLVLSTVANQAVITGTPTGSGPLPQTYPVVLTVTDFANRTATVPISWTINYPPFAAAVPGPQKSTVNTALLTPLVLTVTGGSGSFTWTGGATLPAGLTMTTAGVITGTPTAVGVDASATSVTLTATDTKSSVSPGVFAYQTFTFIWSVYNKPTVVELAPAQVTFGASVVNLQLTTTCPNSPCSYVFNNGPAGFAIGISGLLNGTDTSLPQTFSAASFTVTDNSGATATSNRFTVVVNPAPILASPGNQITAPGAAIVPLNVASLVTGGTAPLTPFTSAFLPTWLTLNASTGVITGTAPTTPEIDNGVQLGVLDAYGILAISPTFSWTVGAAPSPPQNVSVANGDGKLTTSWTAPASTNGSAVTGYRATLNTGAFCDAPTPLTTPFNCQITGLTNGVHYSVTVTATNGYGTSAPSSPAVIGIPFPASVMSAAGGMTLWLDGADSKVLFTGTDCTGALATATTPLGCWKDKSTQGENFNQTTPANQPTVGSWNSLSAANFADSGRIMNSINSADTYQTVFVATNVANPAAASIVDLFGSATNDFNVRIGTGVGRNNPNNNDWAFGTTSPGGVLNWANGVQMGGAPTPTQIITTDVAPGVQSNTMSVSNTFLSRGIVGAIGDVITFNKALTTADRHAVELYLSNKWGVAIAPVAAPSAPQAVAVVPNDSALTASWAVPASISGATGITYTATANPGGGSCTTTALTCQITGLTNGVTYSLAVTAASDYGIGPASAPAVTVTPYPAVMSNGNGMSLWLDGSDPNVFFTATDCSGTPITTGSIGCWRDKSGLGQNFSQATPASQPAIGSWNSRSSANFANPGRVLNSFNSTGQYRTVFVAVNTTSPTGSYNYLFGQQGPTQDFNVRVGTAIPRSAPNGNDWSVNTGSPTHNWYNGEQATTKGQGGPMITADEAQSLQSFAASVSTTFAAGNPLVNRGFVGQLGDVITFNKTLSVAERRSVEEYLRIKWGVIVTPGAPTAITASRPTTTTGLVSWTAPTSNGGAGITTYNVKISNGQTFSTTNTTISFNGLSTTTRYTFTVTATNSAGIGPSSAPSGSI